MNSSSILPALQSHPEHDPRWLQPGSRQGSIICLACLTEMLEDKELVGVKTKIVLVELVSVLGHDAVLSLLGENVPVHVHIAMILLEYLWHTDESLACLAVEALVQLLGAFGSKELLSEVLENLTGMCNNQTIYKRNLPAFHFLGKILQKIPPVVELILQRHGTFLDYVCSGLSESDEAVQSAIIYVLSHFYQPGCIQGVSPYVHKAVVENLPKMIITTNQQDLQMNIIGLLKLVLNVPDLTQQLMLSSRDGTTLAAGLKKLLICQRDVLQIATVQCISQVLTQDQGCAYADNFLHVDVAEFLFESLATTNEVLLGSILCCLLQFTGSEIFFKNHHSVYGLESILRGTEQALRLRNPQTVTPAMKLLAILLEKHPPGISLFSNTTMLAQALQLITDGIKFSQPTVAQQAVRALQHVIKHCPKGGAPQQDMLVPLQYLKQQAVTVLSDVTSEKKSKAVKRRDRKGGQRMQDKLEETLDQMVKVLVAVSEYVCECLEDPRPDLISSAPVSLGSDGSAEALTAAGLAEFLLLASDEVCLPLTMIYCEETPKPPVLQSVYRFLCLQYNFKLPEMHSISKKYAETEFICFTLETKANFRDKILEVVIEEFMMHVCSDLFSAHHAYTDTMAYKTLLTQGLPHLQGSTEDLLSLLSEMDDNESSWVQSAQMVYISIMFFEAYYTNSCRVSSVPTSRYCESLSNFILSRHNLSSVPEYSWWQIMYLWAVFSKGAVGQQNTSSHHQLKALSVLVNVAKDLTVGENLITTSAALLTWTFSNSDLAELVGTKMLKPCLSLTGVENKENYNQLVSLVMENQLCLQSLLGLVSLGEEDVTEAAVKLLKDTLEKGLEGNADTTTFSDLEENITSTTQQMCLAGKDWDVPSHNLVAMFEILALIKKLHCDLVSPTSGDMKLLYHAGCIMKKDTTSVGLRAAVLGYLCCVLVQSKLHNDIQASSLLLSDRELLNHLHHLVTSSTNKVTSSSCIILSVLLLQQHSSKLNVCSHSWDAIELADLIRLIASGKVTTQAAVLCLCSSYFATDCRTNVLIIRGKKSDTQPHPKDLPWYIDSYHIRVLHIRLQQVIAQGGDFACQFAVDCMKNMLSFLMRSRKELGKHILNQPWNSFMIELALDPPDTNLGIAFFWPHLLEMMADGPALPLLLTEHLSNDIVQRILGHTDDEHNDEQNADMMASLIILMEKLLTCPWYHISDGRRHELEVKLDLLRPLKERYRLSSTKKAWSLLLEACCGGIIRL